MGSGGGEWWFGCMMMLIDLAVLSAVLLLALMLLPIAIWLAHLIGEPLHHWYAYMGGK